VVYESLISESSALLRLVCAHCGIEYEPKMLMVSNRGSSHKRESISRGFDSSMMNSWKSSLTDTEIWLCQFIYPRYIKGAPVKVRPNIFALVKLLLTLPLYCFMSAILSINSYGSLFSAIARRLLK
jgi:hypothetical protein